VADRGPSVSVIVVVDVIFLFDAMSAQQKLDRRFAEAPDRFLDEALVWLTERLRRRSARAAPLRRGRDAFSRRSNHSPARAGSRARATSLCRRRDGNEPSTCRA